MDSIHDPPFRFLSLPPELRDYIYRNVLTTTYLIESYPARLSLSAGAHDQLRSSQHPTTTRLAILQVSKLIHHEAKQILYGLSTFRFEFSSTGLPLYQDLSKRSTATLMQNIDIQLVYCGGYINSPNKGKFLQPTTSVLEFFGGSSIPRSTLVISIRFLFSTDFLLDASLLDALGKLTGFKTVVVTLMALPPFWIERLRWWGPQAPKYDDLDEYDTLDEFDILDEHLKAKLGAGEKGEFDKRTPYRLTYHPRGRAA